jgi:putative metalloprotease
MPMELRRFLLAAILTVTACTIEPGEAPSQSPPQQTRAPAEAPQAAKLEPEQAQRLQRLMAPLIQHMDNKVPLNQVKIGVMADSHINAANAGSGQFFVTTGLLQKANDDQLRAILAHEVAHEDLGHVAKTQTLATGLEIGIALLEQIYPGSSALTPIAGTLLVNAYTRREETEADAHAVKILQRAGFNGKAQMAGALQWIAKTEGGSSGGFFATHPATDDRIAAVQRLP